jgi:hypothetical protein
MKRTTFSIILLALLLAMAPAAGATMHVPYNGETGWQPWSTTFEEAFSGTAYIGVSNFWDTAVPATLLVDNLTGFGPAGNRGFESGLTGYSAQGAATVGTSATSAGGTVYGPTEGSQMAILTSYGALTSPMGPQVGGTNGAYLTFAFSANADDTISFDWNFLPNEEGDFYHDFAFLIGVSDTGQIVHFEKLAEIGESGLYGPPTSLPTPNPVPEPCTMLLVGGGLAGLAALKRRRG